MPLSGIARLFQSVLVLLALVSAHPELPPSVRQGAAQLAAAASAVQAAPAAYTWRHIGGSSVAGIGDFNHSGTSEILFRNNSTDDTGYYQIGVSGAVTWHHLGIADISRAIVGVGDFNNDGSRVNTKC